MASEFLGRDLIGGDAIRHFLTRNRIAIGPGQPVGAAPVRFVAELVRAALYYGEVGLVPRQVSQALRQGIIRARLAGIGKPRFLGHAKANTHKGHSLRRRHGRACGGRCEAAETDGLQRWQRDQRARAAKKVTTIDS